MDKEQENDKIRAQKEQEAMNEMVEEFIEEMEEGMKKLIKEKNNPEVPRIWEKMKPILHEMVVWLISANERFEPGSWLFGENTFLSSEYNKIRDQVCKLYKRADNMLPIIPKNSELSPEDLAVKAHMIDLIFRIHKSNIRSRKVATEPQILNDHYLEWNGTIYGGAVRDRLAGLIPEDIDIRVCSSAI